MSACPLGKGLEAGLREGQARHFPADAKGHAPGAGAIAAARKGPRLLHLHLHPDLSHVRAELLAGKEASAEEGLGLGDAAGFDEGQGFLEDEGAGKAILVRVGLKGPHTLVGRPAEQAQHLVEPLVDLGVVGIRTDPFGEDFAGTFRLAQGMEQGETQVAVQARDLRA